MGVWAAEVRSSWNLKRALQALGSKTVLPFHCQATVNQHHPGYFGRFGILFISPRATICAKCSVLFVIGSSSHPGAFLLTENKHLTTVLWHWSRADIQTQQQTISKLMSTFHPSPRPSTFPQVMLLKRSDIKNGYHEGLPQRKHRLATPIGESESLH